MSIRKRFSISSDGGLAALLLVIASYGASLAIVNLASGLKVLSLTNSKVLLALTVLAYNTAYTLMSFIWVPIFSNRLSRSSLVSIALIVIGASSLGMALINNAYIIIVLNAIYGLFSSIITPVMTTIITDYVGKDSIALTRLNMASSIGMIIGYMIASFLRSSLGLDAVLLTSGMAILISAFIPLTFPPKYRVIEPRRTSNLPLLPLITGRLRSLPSLLILINNIKSNITNLVVNVVNSINSKMSRKLPLTYLATTILFTAISIFFTPIPAYLRYLGFTDSELFLLALVSITVSTITYRFLRKIIESCSNAWCILLISVGTRAILFMLPSLLKSRIVILVMYILIGASWAGISLSLTMIILCMSEIERREERLSMLNASISIGLILGSLISGPIAEVLGFNYVFLISSILIVLALATYYRAFKVLVT